MAGATTRRAARAARRRASPRPSCGSARTRSTRRFTWRQRPDDEATIASRPLPEPSQTAVWIGRRLRRCGGFV
eukprot:793302-Alexandrium_andersonii.AAC.1